ncbi:uncharacterized protein LOC110860203 [Folsomia candida]|uniref:uncharacterized protein LOC110860203 n=1 Tax=Folsomia candida TaxID=158441 RepID=UPI0016055061|nr:uncharacterized protein LOC110860203 [Folsomia candida]
MAAEEKFQYLFQATTENSRARTIVASYPPTAENYPKVIESLKSRFGRDEILIEVYVRDLLSFVLSNVSKKGVSISVLYDKLETQLRALESLGVTSDKYAAMLFLLVESSLPEDMLRIWERSRQKSQEEQVNRLAHLMEFLRVEVESDVRIKMAQTGFGNNAQKKDKYWGEKVEPVSTAAELYNGEPSVQKICVFCDKKHFSSDCYQAAKMSLEDKKKKVQEKRACFICLTRGHMSKFCKSKVKCPLCGRLHFALMCPDNPKNKSENPSQKQVDRVDTAMSNYSHHDVMLQTLEVRICNKAKGEERLIRVVIDTGSQRSYVSKKAVEVLGFKSVGEKKIAHCLFGGQETNVQRHKLYEITLQSKNRKFNCNIIVLDQEKICGKISRIPQGPWFKVLKSAGIELTDVERDDELRDIHVLIGADVAGDLFTGKIHRTHNGPVAMETRLGWTLMGKITATKEIEDDSSLMATSLHVRDLDIQALWKLDLIGITDPGETKTREELMESATKHFKDNVQVNDEGRYEVALPWIEGHKPVSENRVLAERRLQSATSKLKSIDKMEDYGKVFCEWLQMGIIERVPVAEVERGGSYLPHRPVFKPESTTTPIRPVFDASAKCNNYPSLNDCLEKGENLIELIPSVVTRFRAKQYGVVSDVKKAFLQICVRKEDRDFLKFLWWEDYGAKKIEVFRHCRVVFGVSSSPFLLASTINHHLDNVKEEDRSVAQLLKKSLYVDNCCTSVDGKQQLQEFVSKSTTIMAAGKFELRGWIWNGEEEYSEEDRVTHVLGLLWDLTSDCISLDVKDEEFDGILTKRRILSAANSVYDPIGFSSPVTLLPKLLLQELWMLKIGWDEGVPEPVKKKFDVWKSEVGTLKNIQIPRRIFNGVTNQRSIHVFSDGSKLAYSACVFVRNDGPGGVNVQLVTAKARVAPVKRMTIPRLELLGCCIAVRLGNCVRVMLEAENLPITYWTDSSCALYWIQKNENWATFVNNRVQEIQKSSNIHDWRHVPGVHNPADLPSRGCGAMKLLDLRWWEGPAWLRLPEVEWPRSEVNCDLDLVMSEKKKTVVNHLALDAEIPWYLHYFSSYRKVVRMVAWILRWKRIIKSSSKCAGPLTYEEEADAELHLVRLTQIASFTKDDLVLKQLNVIKDSFGVLRVKTRILMRDDSMEFKLPLLLPSLNPLVAMLIMHVHKSKNHCGVQYLMSLLRERFWILKSRQTVKKIIGSCVICKRFSSKNVTTPEAPLPLDRVRDAAVFEVVGIDLGGPLYLKGGHKAWFVVFTCAVYRALHLELVTSLSTETFLQSLRRFVSRRGRPSIIFSDNGTNFEGTDNAFKSLIGTRLQLRPPFSKLRGSFRRRLHRGGAIINQRPLTYLSDDPNDLAVLTPALFLNEIRSHGLPEVDNLEWNFFNKKYRYRQQLRNDMRQRFREEYLGALVQKGKAKLRGNLKLGDIVLVEIPNKKRVDWPLAKILEVFTGPDGNVRVVKLKTKNGELTRAVQRVFPLEVSTEQRQEVPVAKIIKRSACEVITRSGRKVKVPTRLGIGHDMK